jgi:hypothetical protein
MKKKTKIIVCIIFAILVIFLFYRASTKSNEPGQYDAFAQCLTDKGVVMYGAYWCPHCAEQKRMFGNSFKFINYVECDPKGANANPVVCKEKNIESYPTWIIANEKYTGSQELGMLAAQTGCNLTSV